MAATTAASTDTPAPMRNPTRKAARVGMVTCPPTCTLIRASTAPMIAAELEVPMERTSPLRLLAAAFCAGGTLPRMSAGMAPKERLSPDETTTVATSRPQGVDMRSSAAR